MQLRYAVLAIAAVVAYSNFHSALACPGDSASVPPVQLASEQHGFRADIEDESLSSHFRELAAASAPELTGFSTDVEDESVSAYVRELAHIAARREVIAAMEAIDQAVSEFTSFLTDVEDESVSSYFRELVDASSPNSALQAVDVRTDREIEPVAPAFWSYDAAAEEQDATGSTSTEPLTESP